MRNRPKELGYPWETGVSEDQLKIDDGLGAEYLLPTELCGTPEVISFLLSKPFTWYKIHPTQKSQVDTFRLSLAFSSSDMSPESFPDYRKFSKATSCSGNGTNGI
jgi:hypothetical protein